MNVIPQSLSLQKRQAELMIESEEKTPLSWKEGGGFQSEKRSNLRRKGQKFGIDQTFFIGKKDLIWPNDVFSRKSICLS